jgi:alkylation response protein AidB-like acyl-CoA dehydrogenase
MWTWQAPVADINHLLLQVLDAPARWAAQPAFAELDADTAAAVLAEAGKFAAEVIAPLNARGDQQGCRWSPDGVRTPDGFAPAYQAFVAGGWPALAIAPAHGGQGLPQALNTALFEMLAGANHGWTMYPGLLHGACEVVMHHGVAELRAHYLAKLVSGEWLGTMALTEPQAGSDLGGVRTQAEPEGGVAAANGVPVRVSGSKIFISGGDQDLTDNIVHLVLCRLPDAPAGSKGLSLALVPKILPDGARNTVVCDGIEHKLGIHGSATCQLRFDQARGWLIGEPHRGLAAMFLMMNAARLHVAVQGVGHMDAALQNASAYAAERRQMRAPQRPAGAAAPAAGGDPIAWHPAMRRTLMALRARTDACRTLALWTALWLDEAEHHPDAAHRAAAAGHVALLTPVAKAWFTELGHRSAGEALQVFGGYGYVREYGIEQTLRDSRIAMIYEGSNEIQAIDLVQRKLLDDGGARAQALMVVLAVDGARCAAVPGLRDFAQALDAQVAAWQQAMALLQAGRSQDADYPLRVADDLLAGVAHVLMAWAWARIALAASDPARAPLVGRPAADWLASARFGLQWLLPQAQVHWQRVGQRDAALPWLAQP